MGPVGLALPRVGFYENSQFCLRLKGPCGRLKVVVNYFICLALLALLSPGIGGGPYDEAPVRYRLAHADGADRLAGAEFSTNVGISDQLHFCCATF